MFGQFFFYFTDGSIKLSLFIDDFVVVKFGFFQLVLRTGEAAVDHFGREVQVVGKSFAENLEIFGFEENCQCLVGILAHDLFRAFDFNDEQGIEAGRQRAFDFVSGRAVKFAVEARPFE